MTPAIETITGLTATGAVYSPSYMYGQFLVTNGFFYLSWEEWIKVLGAAWVAYLLVSGITSSIKTIIKKFKK